METYNFKEIDWKNANPPCSSGDMSPELIERLEYARSLCGFPFRVNSAYRSQDYEHSKGRSGSSSHCKGVAVDLQCLTPEKRLIMVQNLLRSGVRRIGIYENFLHVDIDYEKPACIFLG